MTTIAYDTKSLVSDSRSSIDNLIYEEDAQKIYTNIGPFLTLGIAGSFQDAMDTLEVIKDYTKVDHIRTIPVEELGDCHLLGITYDGDLWSYAGDKSCCLRKDLPFAIGSGSDFALSAMDLGRSAEEAVVYASTRDMYTNDVLQIARLPEEPGELDDNEGN
jgi:20S proteasome alpha/beta subunit